MNTNWTEPKPPTEMISYYDHVISETPLGKAVIEWKSWKDSPSYDLEIDGEWIACCYDLDETKAEAVKHLENKYNELKVFLQK